MVSQVRAASLALLLIGAFPAAAAESGCDGRYSMHLAATAVDFEDRVAQDQFGSGVRVGLGRQNCAAIDGRSHWELDVRWTRIADTGPGNDTQAGLMLQRLRLLGSAPWQPYWQGGLGVVGEQVLGKFHYRPAVEAGLGVIRSLGHNGLALRVDASFQWIFNPDLPDDAALAHDARISVGLMLPLRAGT